MSERFLKGAKVLVTGGAGFIGSNLCESLLSHNNKVVCLDNFSTGKRKNVEVFLDHPDFSLIEGDITSMNDCRKAARGVQVILQQAALGSVPRSVSDPLSTTRVNVDGFLNVLVAARDEKVMRIVYAGSSSVYGDSNASPKEEGRLGRPISPYAVSKYTNELYAHVFGLHYGMEIIGLRYFNVFGKNQDPEGEYAAAIPRFIRALIKHEPPVLFGDGSNSRDFTYVKNVTQMNHLAATTKSAAALGQVFNTATGKSSTLSELIAILKSLLSNYDKGIAEVQVKYAPERPGDIPHSLASIKKAQEMLGYAPEYDLSKGLAEAVDWYWKNLK
jgi:UDP-N-acetylglucosamine/UDP-N-acetylgalactosamine 4-epimerase